MPVGDHPAGRIPGFSPVVAEWKDKLMSKKQVEVQVDRFIYFTPAGLRKPGLDKVAGKTGLDGWSGAYQTYRVDREQPAGLSLSTAS